MNVLQASDILHCVHITTHVVVRLSSCRVEQHAFAVYNVAGNNYMLPISRMHSTLQSDSLLCYKGFNGAEVMPCLFITI